MRPASRSRAYRPRVSAATDGANTSPRTVTAVFAVSTGRNDGAANITVAARASAAAAATRTARFLVIASIAAPMGVCVARAARPPTVVTTPTADWLHPCRVSRNTLR